MSPEWGVRDAERRSPLPAPHFSAACSSCGAEAAATVARGGVQEGLCLACAERRAGIAGLAALVRAAVDESAPTDACPYCGTTVERARRTALAGCPLCYTALASIWRDLGAPPGRYAGGR